MKNEVHSSHVRCTSANMISETAQHSDIVTVSGVFRGPLRLPLQPTLIIFAVLLTSKSHSKYATSHNGQLIETDMYCRTVLLHMTLGDL